MGGLLICISIVLPTLLWSNLTNIYIWIALLGLVGFAGIGFVDDYTKIKQGQESGPHRAREDRPCKPWSRC